MKVIWNFSTSQDLLHLSNNEILQETGNVTDLKPKNRLEEAVDSSDHHILLRRTACLGFEITHVSEGEFVLNTKQKYFASHHFKCFIFQSAFLGLSELRRTTLHLRDMHFVFSQKCKRNRTFFKLKFL